jgi:hypothetical protein
MKMVFLKVKRQKWITAEFGKKAAGYAPKDGVFSRLCSGR